VGLGTYVTVDVDHEVGAGGAVDADPSVGSDLGEHGVMYDVACDVVDVRGERSVRAAWVDGEVAGGVGAHGGDVEHGGGCVRGDATAAGNFHLGDRVRGATSSVLELTVNRRRPRT